MTENSKTPYFIPKTAPATKQGVEAMRREFHTAVSEARHARAPASALDSAGMGHAHEEWVGYYWIGEDNRQKFCGCYDTISTVTAERAQKVYTRPAQDSARKALEAARDADLARFDSDGDATQYTMRLIAEDGWRKALAALDDM
jgi:hypothetical protein